MLRLIAQPGHRQTSVLKGADRCCTYVLQCTATVRRVRTGVEQPFVTPSPLARIRYAHLLLACTVICLIPAYLLIYLAIPMWELQLNYSAGSLCQGYKPAQCLRLHICAGMFRQPMPDSLFKCLQPKLCHRQNPPAPPIECCAVSDHSR